MSENYLFPVTPASEEKISKGCWIMLYHADAVPPHLILLLDGKYYSLSVKGSRYGEPVESLVRSIQQKQHRCLLFSVDLSRSKINNKQELVYTHFKYFVVPEEGEVTCLFPIRTALTELLDVYLENCHYVFDLYRALNQKSLTGTFLEMNMTGLLDDRKGYRLNTYSRAEIDSCIASLKSSRLHVEG